MARTIGNNAQNPCTKFATRRHETTKLHRHDVSQIRGDYCFINGPCLNFKIRKREPLSRSHFRTQLPPFILCEIRHFVMPRCTPSNISSESVYGKTWNCVCVFSLGLLSAFPAQCLREQWPRLRRSVRALDGMFFSLSFYYTQCIAMFRGGVLGFLVWKTVEWIWMSHVRMCILGWVCRVEWWRFGGESSIWKDDWTFRSLILKIYNEFELWVIGNFIQDI